MCTARDLRNSSEQEDEEEPRGHFSGSLQGSTWFHMRFGKVKSTATGASPIGEPRELNEKKAQKEGGWRVSGVRRWCQL